MRRSSRGQGRPFGGERGRVSANRGRFQQQGGGRNRGRGFTPPAPAGSVIYNGTLPTTLERRLADDTQDRLIASFSQIRVSEDVGPGRPLRPSYGTVGRAITLRANFFAVKLPRRSLFDYSIEINPEIKDQEKRGMLFERLEQLAEFAQYLPHIAHDRSARVISSKRLQLPAPPIFTVEYSEGPPSSKVTKYTFTIQPRTPAELTTADLAKYLAGDHELRSDDEQGRRIKPLISALNIVLQSHASKTGFRMREASEKSSSRYFFPSLDSLNDLSLNLGIRAVRGYFVSVRPALTQLMVNVNACMTPFFFFEQGNLGDILDRFNANHAGAFPNLPDHFLKAKVTTHYRGYKKRHNLIRVENRSARRYIFKVDNVDTTVEDYFRNKYKISLRRPDDLPVVNVGGTTVIPAELCYIEAQPYRGKLSKIEGQKMLEHATHPPRRTAELIVDQGLRTLNLTSKSDFRIEISREMTNVPARILPPPTIAYRHNNSLQVKADTASWNLVRYEFQTGVVVQRWWTMVISDGQRIFSGPQDNQLTGLHEAFLAKLRKVGITVNQAQPDLIFVQLPAANRADPSREQAVNAIRRKLKDKLRSSPNKPSFVLVLFNSVDSFIYPGIKRIGDIELGLHTVHMLLADQGKRPPALDPSKRDPYFSNVALKINTKLGGINHLLDPNSMEWLNKKQTMVVGIDVTHPSPDSKFMAPSIAAMVASTDSTFSQYPASLSLQRSGQEMVENLGQMLHERLEVYRKKNKSLPERIIVFRDGVSEGQFDLLIRDEIPQIIGSFEKEKSGVQGKAYRPALSYIVCGKRHHAKFFATSPEHADRNGNTLPGTIIDRGVTAVFDFDFYLQAHAGLKGTVRTTHYTVVYDEVDFKADELQQGINNSCYTYGRATRAVSLIPAAYYADLACDRARFYLNDIMNLAGKNSKNAKKPKTEAEKEAERRRVFREAKEKWGDGLHADIKGSMFYL